MCGRFCIAASPGELKERYGIFIPKDYSMRYNISPGRKILIITKESQKYKADMREWGISSDIAHRIINARIETVHKKPLFKSLFDKNRCLVPASGYFEWRSDGNRKTPFYFTSPSGALISFAGLVHPNPTGDQVVILTTDAKHPYSRIHDRMPVILEPSDEHKYLSDGEISYISKTLNYYEVSSMVNQVKLDNPDLVKPVRNHSDQKTLDDIL